MSSVPSTQSLHLKELFKLIRLGANLKHDKKRMPKIKVHPYFKTLQLTLENLEEAVEESALFQENVCAQNFEIATTSVKVSATTSSDPRQNYATLLQRLLTLAAYKLHKIESFDELLSVTDLEDLMKLMTLLKLITVIPSCEFQLVISNQLTGTLCELWSKFTDMSIRIDMLCKFLHIFVKLCECHIVIRKYLNSRFLLDFLVSVEHLKHYKNVKFTEFDSYLTDNISTTVLCKLLFYVMQQITNVRFQKQNPPKWFQKQLDIQISTVVNKNGGVRSLLLAVDEMGKDVFWKNYAACSDLTNAVLKTCNNHGFFKQFRDFFLEPSWGPKLGLFLATLIARVDKLPPAHSIHMNVVLIDFMVRPFELLFHNKISSLSSSVENGYWESDLDNALWLSENWFQHISYLPKLKLLSRFNKFFAICMLLNGNVCMLNVEKANQLRNFTTALSSVLTGMLNSFNDWHLSAEFLIQTLLMMTNKRLPTIKVTFIQKSRISVVEENKILKRALHYNEVFLEIEENLAEVSDIIDCYSQSIVKVIEKLKKEEKHKFVIDLFNVCLKKWMKCDEEEHWSLTSSKWITSMNSSEFEVTEKSSHVIEYFMAIFERLLEVTFDSVDEEILIKLLEMAEVLISKSLADLETEIANFQMLDIDKPESRREMMEVRAKILHLALGFCGLAIFEGQQTEKILHKLGNNFGVIQELIEMVKKNKNYFDESWQHVCDSAQQLLTLGVETTNLKVRSASGIKQQPAFAGQKKPSSLVDTLTLLRSDFANEFDGSIEIAERGHAIISIERLLRKHDEHMFSELENGLNTIFDALTENLRHPDSYVYLATINALVELCSWKHTVFLHKMMFLLSCSNNDEESDDDEDVDEDQKLKGGVTSSLRCRVQMGEALSKVTKELGDLAPSYYNTMFNLFTGNLINQDPLICASALSGLSNLVETCRGRYFTKNINEILSLCASNLSVCNEVIVRRASAHLLRSILISCQRDMFTELKSSFGTLSTVLRKCRHQDPDEVVRLHADLALIEIEEAIKKEFVDDPLEQYTRVLRL